MRGTDLKEKIEQAKKVDIIGYLKSIGHKPKRLSGIMAYYYSPFKDERNPSLSVNIKTQKWKLWNESDAHGDIIDLVQRVENCNLPEALDILLGKHSRIVKLEPYKDDLPKEVPKAIEVVKVSQINDIGLIEYGLSRRIDLEVLHKYYKEVHVRFPYSKKDKEKIHVCLGFRGDAGHWELRNNYLKVSSSPKTITTIKNKGKEIYLFEGNFNFSAFLSYFGVLQLPGAVYILNGIGQSGALAVFLKGKQAFGYLDNDAGGDDAYNIFIEAGVHVLDCRSVYSGFNDFNDYILRDLAI